MIEQQELLRIAFEKSTDYTKYKLFSEALAEVIRLRDEEYLLNVKLGKHVDMEV